MSNIDYSVLDINAEEVVDKICNHMRESLVGTLKKRGVVLGISGGIDSSVTLALAVRAIGKEKVFTLQMPEKHSASETLDLSGMLADFYKVDTQVEDISGILNSVGFYRRYDEIVQSIIPEYGDGWKSKIVLPSLNERKGFSIFSVVAQSPDGETIKKRMNLKAYLGIVAATNFKQRIRKMLEYYHGDRLNFAVLGTPNRLEYDQGFFVKLGDGAADIKPIAHLYKTQVYKLAEFLGVPEEIRKRPPTTDTYSLEQGQDEFYFTLPYDKMDLCLYAKNNGFKPADVCDAVGITPEQAEIVFHDIDQKRSTTAYLHTPPLLVEEIR